MMDFITRPLRGRDVRMFFTTRGKLRFILSDAIDALGANHRTKHAIRDIRHHHIRSLSRTDPTETVDQTGLNVLSLNTVAGRGLEYQTSFLRSLPRGPQADTQPHLSPSSEQDAPHV